MTPVINKRLKGVQSRLLFQLVIHWAARGLAIGAILSILLMIVSRFVPIGFDLIRASLSILVGCAAIGAITGLLKPVSTFDAAFACDVRLGFKERISSAVEFSTGEITNPLVPALIADAERYADRIRPTRDFPLRLPREILYALILVVVAGGLYFVPPWQYVFASDEDREDYLLVQDEAENIRDIAHEIVINPPPERSDDAEDIARQLQELARDMEFGTVSRREALERLGEIDEQISQSQEESGYNDLRQQLAELAEQLAGSENLRDAAEALNEGNADQAREALEKLADDLENGRVPSENLSDLADALENAAREMAGNPDTADAASNLSQAASDLRAAAEAASAEQASIPPEELARQLIDMIDRAIPELDDLDVPDDIRDQAREMLENIRDDLQNALDSGNVTQQDITNAREGIEAVKDLLEQAGADFSSPPDTRTEEEIARELLQEAERLENSASGAESLSSSQRQSLQQTCQGVASDLNSQLSQGSCSSGSNRDARDRLDEVRRALEEAGVEQDEMGQQTQCSGGQCQHPGQSGQPGSQGSSGLQGLFGQRGQPGQPGQCGQAGQSLRQFGESLGQCRSQLNSGRSFDKTQQGLQSSRSCISGTCNNPGSSNRSGSGTGSSSQSGYGNSSSGDRAASGWGTATTPYGVSGAPVTPGQQNMDWNDPTANPNDTTDYERIYSSQFENSQSFETQLEGNFTDSGGSYVFIEATDPDTGETSYIPYFSIEPTDVTALMDAIEDQDIPRSYSDFVRFYFEQLASGTPASE